MNLERFFITTSSFTIPCICLKTNGMEIIKIKEGSAGIVLHVIDEIDMSQTKGKQFIRKVIKEYKVDYIDRILMGPSRYWPNLQDRKDASFYLFLFFVEDKRCLQGVDASWLLFKQWVKLL